MIIHRVRFVLPGLLALVASSACTPRTPPATAPQPAAAPPPAQTVPQPAAQPAAQPAPAAIRTSGPLTSLDVHRIVPAPVSVVAGSGAPFTLAAGTSIVVEGSDAAVRIAEAMASVMRKSTGFALPVSRASGAVPTGAITLQLGGPATLGAEGYELHIATDSVRLVAAQPAGLFLATQTFRQLLPYGIEAEQSVMRMASAWSVPVGRISDRPRFAWRGAMLDVSRHFFTVDEVKQFIDLLALYKLNTLHLHLADDQGWRIQIDSWPKLTQVGGSTQVGGGPGGFYTKAEYADIVRYAADNYITVVPEIDMPGHTNAAIASYPELGCSRPTPGIYGGTQPLGVYTGIRVGWSTLCSDSAVTYRFVEDVVRELAAMTPGPYLHIGGDEVEALSREQYAKFVERVQDIVYKYGKTMVGWEEVGKAKLRSTSLAQLWRSDTALLALKNGAKLIMSPAPKTYLDMKYTPATELGLRWAGFVELKTAYDWDPATYLKGLSEDVIVGVEAPLWSETVRNLGAAQYLVMPRLPALAEVGWSPQASRDWESFRARIAAHGPRWRLMGVNFYPSPQVAWPASFETMR
jgi:hexosaminidase